MEKARVAEVLEEIGTLLELKGENPFKSRAYQTAARTIEGMSENLTTVIAEGRLGKLRGIGAALVEKITELVQTGKLAYHEDLKASMPPGLLELVKIPSLGPKKVKAIWEQLDVKSLGELEYACKENRLANLPGFGQKSQEKVLAGIEHLKRFAGSFLHSSARQLADQILSILKQHPAVIRLEVAGSLRRAKEIVRDVDIVCATADAERVMDAFVAVPGVESIIGRGPTKTSLRMRSGLQVDLRAVSDLEYPFALLYFTGSKEHNTNMRGRAKHLNLKLNEYGLYDGETAIPCATEADIFERLGLAEIPPEMREDQGEIDAAEARTLPKLVSPADIRGIFHCHSTDSDGRATIREMALAAKACGYTYIGLSDHSQTAVYARGLTEDRLVAQWAQIDQLNAELDGIRILKGVESDILPDGRLDYPDEILARFDFVIGSIHASFQLTKEEQTQRLLTAMSNPYLSMIGHLTGRLLLGREGFPVDMEAIIAGAKKHNVILELNANPHRLDVDWRYLRAVQDAGVFISINPDAHSTAGVADTALGALLARKGWIRPETVLNTRELPQILDFLTKQRSTKGVR